MLNAEDAKRIASDATSTVADGVKVNEALKVIEDEIHRSADKGLYQTSAYLNRQVYFDCIYDILRVLQDSGYVYAVDTTVSTYYCISIKWR